MSLRIIIFLQVLGITSLNSILIPSTIKEDRAIVPRLGRASTWESVLRQAAYQSLTKYTGFTDSLDEKIERDQILLHKIHTGHVERKSKQEGDVNIKSGILVDDPTGNFEFRRGEKSLQGCSANGCLDNSKLLAIWKIQRIKPNHLVVRMKIPLHPSTEDIYQYTPSLGLKLQNSKEMPKLQSTTYVPETVEIPRRNKTFAFPEQSRLDHKNFGNIYKGQPSQERPVTLYYMPPEQVTPSHIMFPQAGNVLPSRDLIAQHNNKDRYSLNSQTVKAILSEFQQDKSYDGFLPSLGPTENPINPYKSTPNLYRPEFKPKLTSTIRGTYKSFKQTTPANFKPSTHFVQYSEQDPLYYSQFVQTEKIPIKEVYTDTKTHYKEIYNENSKIPIKGTIVNNRKIPVKDTSDSYKYPIKGNYWDNSELINKDMLQFISTGKPFELMTPHKELQESSITYQTITTPKENYKDYLVNRYQSQKYPIHITTQEPELKLTHSNTQEHLQRYPSLTTEEPQIKYQPVTPSQEPLKQYPVRITSQESLHKHLMEEAKQELIRFPQETIQQPPLKFPVKITTQESVNRRPTVVTHEVVNKNPIHITTEVQEEITQRYPIRVTTEQPRVRFPVQVTTGEPTSRHSIRVSVTKEPELKYTTHAKAPEVIYENPIQVTTPNSIKELTDNAEIKNRIPSKTLTIRRQPIAKGEHRNILRHPPRVTESQEKDYSIESQESKLKRPSSINEQLSEIDNSEREASAESAVNNINVSGEKESTEEIKENLTTELPTTTKSYVRKYKKGNRNWNVRNNAKNRTKTRESSNYFRRWGDRVRSTTEPPTRHRINNRAKESSTTPPSTEVMPVTTEDQTESVKEDSEVFESQTVSSIEIAPSELTQSGEYTTQTTTVKKQDETTTLLNTNLPSETEITLAETTTQIAATTTPVQSSEEEVQNEFRNKTPEEIVNALTALGLRNAVQTEETTAKNESTSTLTPKPPDLITRLQAGQYAPQLDDNETSLVVNRVSKSVSFKTARGLSGRIMHPSNILVAL